MKKAYRSALALGLGALAVFFLGTLGEVLSRKGGMVTRGDILVFPTGIVLSVAGTWRLNGKWVLIPIVVGAYMFGRWLRQFGHGGSRWR